MNDATYELDQLELAFADATRELGYTEVRAPITGIVTSRLVNLGDYITVNQHLFDLVDFDTIVARVYVPERELERMRLGQTARIFSASLGGETKDGSVLRIAPVVDPKSGTVKVTVDVPRQRGLRPGMYVEIELVTDTREDALLLPKRAVILRPEPRLPLPLAGRHDGRAPVDRAARRRPGLDRAGARLGARRRRQDRGRRPGGIEERHSGPPGGSEKLVGHAALMGAIWRLPDGVFGAHRSHLATDK